MARRGRPRKKNRSWGNYFTAFFIVAVALLVVFTSINLAVKMPDLGLFAVSDYAAGDTVSSSVMKDVEKEVQDKSLLFLDVGQLREKIEKLHPEVKKLSVLKRFPSTLCLEAEMRQPFFQLKANIFYVIGKDYTVIEKIFQPDPLLVTVEIDNVQERLEPGELIEDIRVKKAGVLLRLLSRFEEFPPQTILAHNLESLAFITDNKKVILGAEELNEKLDRLRTLAREGFDDDFAGARYIDLRYSKIYIGR